MKQPGQYNYKKLERIVNRKKVNLRNFKMIFVPVNIEHYHWFLLCADLVNKQILVIDSMHPREEEAMQHALNFKKFLQDYFNNNKL